MIKSDIEEKNEKLQELHSRIYRMNNFLFNTANADLKERAV